MTVFAAVTIVLILTITTIGLAKAYTLDATLGPSKLSILGQPTMELQNITITDLPKDLQATNATLITTYGGAPTITIHPTYVGFSGSLQYTTPDGSTNLASTTFVPDIKKISKGNFFEKIPYVYTLKSSFSGPDGKLSLTAPALIATKGTIHLEGIEDPKTTD
jgi:hypothetical protein